MKRFMVSLLSVLLLMTVFASASLAEVEKSPLLDAAFSLLEKDNVFQRRYNEITGSQVESLFELGVPYFFGRQVNHNGQLLNVKYLVEKYPDYSIHTCMETTKFYRKGQLYIYGMDCSGFTRWVYTQCGLPLHPGLMDMITRYDCKKHHLFNGGTNWSSESKPMPAYHELKDHLQVGDLLVTNIGGRHIMMYIGTPADYGFTAEEVPDLAPYLDYPLVIHCGPSPFYGERFEKLIQENEKYSRCNTTNGGVEVSIVGVQPGDAPYHTHVQITDFDYFLIDDGEYMLTLREIDTASSFCWYRM